MTFLNLLFMNHVSLTEYVTIESYNDKMNNISKLNACLF